jgi:hypothetical protein
MKLAPQKSAILLRANCFSPPCATSLDNLVICRTSFCQDYLYILCLTWIWNECGKLMISGMEILVYAFLEHVLIPLISWQGLPLAT